MGDRKKERKMANGLTINNTRKIIPNIKAIPDIGDASRFEIKKMVDKVLK